MIGVRMLGALAFCCAALAALARADEQGDALLRHARETWRTRTEAPYVQYGVRTRYEEGGHVMDTWYGVTYRASDGAIEVDRIHMPGDERRLGGFVLSIFGAPIIDTNPDAEVVMALREPAIEPGFTFGLMPRAYRSPLNIVTADPTPGPFSGDLREIGRVIAVNREYQVSLAGVDRMRYGDAYHLTLLPLRDPHFNRLRDLWIATGTYELVQETVAGILDTRPYDSAAWTVTYVPVDGRMYIQQVRTNDALRFGERKVAGFQLDFVDYRFPASLPDHIFEHWL